MRGSCTVRSTISCNRIDCLPSCVYVTQSDPSMDPLITLDLAAVHDAPGLRIERIASVQHGKIVPQQESSELPPVAEGEPRLRRMRPQSIEQRLTLGHLKAEHVSVRTTPQKERLAAGGGLGADQWMASPHCLPNVRNWLVALAEHSRTVGRCVVHRDLVLRSRLQLCGQG